MAVPPCCKWALSVSPTFLPQNRVTWLPQHPHLGWFLDLESSSARGWTLFSATSVSTENVGSTMKSMKPVAKRITPWRCLTRRLGSGYGCHGRDPWLHVKQQPGAEKFPMGEAFGMMSLSLQRTTPHHHTPLAFHPRTPRSSTACLPLQEEWF